MRDRRAPPVWPRALARPQQVSPRLGRQVSAVAVLREVAQASCRWGHRASRPVKQLALAERPAAAARVDRQAELQIARLSQPALLMRWSRPPPRAQRFPQNRSLISRERLGCSTPLSSKPLPQREPPPLSKRSAPAPQR